MVIYFAAPWLSKKYLSTSMRIVVYYLDGYWIWRSMKINRFIHEHGTLTVKERKYFYFPVLIQNWISFPQIFLSSQTWRMYKKRT